MLLEVNSRQNDAPRRGRDGGLRCSLVDLVLGREQRVDHRDAARAGAGLGRRGSGRSPRRARRASSRPARRRGSTWVSAADGGLAPLLRPRRRRGPSRRARASGRSAAGPAATRSTAAAFAGSAARSRAGRFQPPRRGIHTRSRAGAALDVLLDEPVPVQLAQVIARRAARLPQRRAELARRGRAAGVELGEQPQPQRMGQSLERGGADDVRARAAFTPTRLECKDFFAKSFFAYFRALPGAATHPSRSGTTSPIRVPESGAHWRGAPAVGHLRSPDGWRLALPRPALPSGLLLGAEPSRTGATTDDDAGAVARDAGDVADLGRPRSCPAAAPRRRS